MNPPVLNHPLIAVIGDVHHHIGLAAEGLQRIESEIGSPVTQVFSVGDLGLFLQESDWDFLTGPAKYRRPEISPAIRAAWSAWRWPISMIGGNHEPFHLLRNWSPSAFSNQLHYTDAGELRHTIPGLRVAGLSGIHHPAHMDFITEDEAGLPRGSHAKSWPEMVALARARLISRKRLTYYKSMRSNISAIWIFRHTWSSCTTGLWPPRISRKFMTAGRKRKFFMLFSRVFCAAGTTTHPQGSLSNPPR